MLNGQKKFAESKIIEIFISTVKKVWQQKQGNSGELKMHFDPLKKQFIAHQVYQIVEQVRNPNKEIALNDELFQNKQVQIQENYLLLPVSLKEIINCKEVLPSFREALQRHYQTEWYQTFLPWQGKVVEGVIQEIHPQYCLVDLLDQKKIGY